MSDLKIVIGNKKTSSWSLRGWLAVKISGLDFQEIKIPLDTKEFYERIKVYSPTGCVPVLLHGDAVIWDSLAIIDTIDRLCPDLKLWPAELAAYGHAKAISAEMHSGFAALRNAAPMYIGSSYSGLGLSEAVAKDVARVDTIWSETREKFGKGGDFLFGGFGAADIMYAPVVHRFNSYDLPRSDISDTYIKAVLEHPDMQAWADEAIKESWSISQYLVDPETKILGE